MEREGSQIGYLSATVVPADGYFTSLLAAPSEQLVRDALARAGVAFQRISPALHVPRRDVDEAIVSAGNDDPTTRSSRLVRGRGQIIQGAEHS